MCGEVASEMLHTSLKVAHYVEANSSSKVAFSILREVHQKLI